MNSNCGRKSAADMREQQKQMLARAEAVHPTVTVTEPNWRALIDSQREQVRALEQILLTLDTLATTELLTEYLNWQLDTLKEEAQQSAELVEQYRQTLAEQTAQTTELLTKHCGNVSEEFSKCLSQERSKMTVFMKRSFLLGLLPSLLFLLLQWMPHIWPPT